MLALQESNMKYIAECRSFVSTSALVPPGTSASNLALHFVVSNLTPCSPRTPYFPHLLVLLYCFRALIAFFAFLNFLDFSMRFILILAAIVNDKPKGTLLIMVRLDEIRSRLYNGSKT